MTTVCDASDRLDRPELSKESVRGQPWQFLARRRAKRLALRQPIDEIRLRSCARHLSTWDRTLHRSGVSGAEEIQEGTRADDADAFVWADG